MQTYPVRASHRAQLVPESLARLVAAHFGSARTEGDSVVTTCGAISRLVVRGQDRALVVDVTMNAKVPEDVARDTIGRYNRFLEETTGYSSKERARRLRKSAGGPSSEA